MSAAVHEQCHIAPWENHCSKLSIMNIIKMVMNIINNLISSLGPSPSKVQLGGVALQRKSRLPLTSTTGDLVSY